VKKDHDSHLNEDQLIQALVDSTAVPHSVQRHLAACPRCQAEQHRLEAALTRLGHMAKALSPSPTRSISLSVNHSPRRLWQKALVAALAAAVLVLFVSYGPVRREVQLAALNQEMDRDEQFLMEVTALSEDPLPEFWQAMALISDVGFDNAFMDFLVPSSREDVVSKNKEDAPC